MHRKNAIEHRNLRKAGNYVHAYTKWHGQLCSNQLCSSLLEHNSKLYVIFERGGVDRSAENDTVACCTMGKSLNGMLNMQGEGLMHTLVQLNHVAIKTLLR